MKEIKEHRLNHYTGIETIMLPENAKIISICDLQGIVVLFEQEKTNEKPKEKEFILHKVASFDYVPPLSRYLGSIIDENELLHVYHED